MPVRIDPDDPEDTKLCRAVFDCIGSSYTHHLHESGNAFLSLAKAPTPKQAIAGLVELLTNEDLSVRRGAVKTLGEIGPDARDAVPALIGALKDNDFSDRNLAAQAIAAIGRDAEKTLPALMRAFRDTSERQLRDNLAFTLACVGGRGAVPVLVEALEDPLVRHAALIALGVIGPQAKEAVPALLDFREPSDNDWSVQRLAIWTLARIGLQAVPALMEFLKVEKAPPEAVATALGSIGPDAREAVPALIEKLRDTSGMERKTVIEALARIVPDIEKAVPSYIKEGDLEAELRSAKAARLALGLLGPEVISALLETFFDWNSSRLARNNAERELQFAAPETVPLLVGAIRGPTNSAYDITIIRALGNIGPDAQQAVPALIEALKSYCESIRKYAALALGRIGPRAAQAIPTLAEALHDCDRDVCTAAVEALGEIGPDAKEAIPVLMEAVKGKLLVHWSLTTHALQAIGEEAVLALMEILEEETEEMEVRCRAAGILGYIGPPARCATPALKRIAEDCDKSSHLRDVSYQALDEIVRKSLLIDALKDDDVVVRATAALRLACLGQSALPATSALVEALGDTSLYVRKAAVHALAAIGKKASREAVPALVELIGNRDEGDHIRRRAVSALVRLEERARRAEFRGENPDEFRTLDFRRFQAE